MEGEKKFETGTDEGKDDNPNPTRVVFLTGGSAGIGFDCCRQLTHLQGVEKVILSSRSLDRANAAIKRLALATGKPETIFQAMVLDTGDPKSIQACVAELPSLNALVMNASSPGASGTEIGPRGVSMLFQSTTLGHAELLEGLLKVNKLAKHARVIFSGTPATRNVWLFTGFQPWVRCEEGMVARYTTNPPSSCIPVRAKMASYGNAKLLGGLYLSAVAKEHPEIYFATVSPGGVNTNVYDQFPCPLPFCMSNCSRIFACLGAIHPVEVGAKRYVDAVSVRDFPERFPSGSVVGSPSTCCPFYLGATGPLTNQNTLASYYENAALQVETLSVVRKALEMER